jgi:predicted P-loop ATPase
VKVGQIDLDGLKRDMPQLWAEARVAFEAGEPWWLDREAEALARDEQAERQVEDPWTGVVLGWVEGLEFVVIADVLSGPLAIETHRQDQSAHKRVASILRANGWVRGQQRRINGRAQRPYVRLAKCHPSEGAAGCTGDGTGDSARAADGLASSPIVTPVTRVTRNSSSNSRDHHLGNGHAGGGLPRETYANQGLPRVTGDIPPDGFAL